MMGPRSNYREQLQDICSLADRKARFNQPAAVPLPGQPFIARLGSGMRPVALDDGRARCAAIRMTCASCEAIAMLSGDCV